MALHTPHQVLAVFMTQQQQSRMDNDTDDDERNDIHTVNNSRDTRYGNGVIKSWLQSGY
jgi:hypothetical protein